MQDCLFKISDLQCAYGHKTSPVLVIDDLSIPKGKVTVILGKSGSGKSTLVETLGLMNNTIRKGEITFYDSHESVSINEKLWEKPRKLSEIRKKHYSFIFQDDYLIPYYTSFENVIIGPLIQKTRLKFNILRSIILKMRSVKLPAHTILDRMPNEMAGGQKQRLSFVRAMMKDFTVVFGDEPTGNLDVTNSEALMEVVKQSLRNSGENPFRSAIIVSHNIDLSVRKADMIVVLSTHGVSNGPSTIEKKNIFNKDGQGRWMNEEGRLFQDDDAVIDHIKSNL